jgi:hypothetical protein
MLHMFYGIESQNTEILVLFGKCEQSTRTAKSQEVMHQKICPDLRDYMPTKQISDKLIQAYLRTFETVYRITMYYLSCANLTNTRRVLKQQAQHSLSKLYLY